MFILIRYLLILVIGLVVYSIYRSIKKSMRQGNQEVLDMPYCQKCESNRHVVVNAGQSPDENERWYCTHCREGF